MGYQQSSLKELKNSTFSCVNYWINYKNLRSVSNLDLSIIQNFSSIFGMP